MPTKIEDQILLHLNYLNALNAPSKDAFLKYILQMSVEITQSQSGFICAVNSKTAHSIGTDNPLIFHGNPDLKSEIESNNESNIKINALILKALQSNEVVYEPSGVVIPVHTPSDSVLIIGLYKNTQACATFSDPISMDKTCLNAIKTLSIAGYNRLNQLETISNLKKSERVFRLTFEQVGSGMCQTDLKGYIIDANQKFCDILGYTHDEAMGLRIKNLTYPEDWKIDKVFKKQLFNYEIPYFSMEKRYFKKDGSLIWVHITVTLMRGDGGEDELLIGVVQDISSQKAAESLLIHHNENLERLIKERTQSLEDLNAQLTDANRTKDRVIQELEKVKNILLQSSTIDPLTSLYNRRFMMEKIDEEVKRVKRNKGSFCLVLIDIDYFKEVNDRMGHDCGDEVLQVLSKMLLADIRDIDTLSRWGGEEFLLLLPETNRDEAFHIAERIRQKCQDYTFTYENKSFAITLTLGISLFDDALTIKEMIKKADHALYHGKLSGRNCVEFGH